MDAAKATVEMYIFISKNVSGWRHLSTLTAPAGTTLSWASVTMAAMFYSSADDTDRPEPVRSHPISISIAPLWWSSRGEKVLINAAPYINLFPPLRLCLASTCSSSNPSPPPTYIYQSKAWKMIKRGIKSTIPHHMTWIDPGMCRRETRLRVYMCTHRFDQRHVAVRRATILSYGGWGSAYYFSIFRLADINIPGKHPAPPHDQLKH